MNHDQVIETIADRLTKWGGFMAAHNATPIVIVGFIHPGNVPVVTTCEGVPDEVIAGLLEVVALSLRAGKAKHT